MDEYQNKELLPIALENYGPDFTFKYSLRESKQRYQNNVPNTKTQREREFGSDWLRLQE